MSDWWNNWSQAQSGSFSGIDLQGLGEVWNAISGPVSGWFGGGVDVSGQTPPQRGGVSTQPSSGGLGDLSSLLNMLGGTAGGGSGAAAAPAGYTTPDGVFIKDGSPEDGFYKLADAVFAKVYGRHPDFAQARVFHDMGVQNTDQLQQILLQMPSHIKQPDGTPITIGVYEDMLQAGQAAAQKSLGRPIPDSLISEWVAQGITTPAAINNWFYQHPASDIPSDQYGAIWDTANQWIQSTWSGFSS